MIKLESRNNYIWNLESALVEIVKAGLTNNEIIEITTIHEGPCLLSCNFYNQLDYICEQFNIDKKRFVIYTSNIEEKHDVYKIKIVDNIWVDIYKKLNYQHTSQIKNNNLQTVGCFVGKLNWPRLSLLAWLDQFQEQTLLTCHYKYTNDDSDMTSQRSLQLNENWQQFPDEIDKTVNFLKTCPRLMPSKVKLPYEKRYNLNQIIEISNFSEGYADIFSELVCETYFSGFTFFPTEKTFRPIQQLTPFLVFGPQGFLSNLRRSGFKTFGDYWDESYDESVEAERIIKLRKVLEQLFRYDQKLLQSMYADMKPILEHNKNRLSELSPKDLLLDE